MIEPIAIPFAPATNPQLTNTLEPHISAVTIEFHFNKHYKGYIKNLNKLVKGTVHEGSELEDVVTSSAGPIFNNAAQAYNHEFYFNCLSTDGGTPSKELEAKIVENWESVDGFQKLFTKQSLAAFGSGWMWLVWNETQEMLQLMFTPNASTPISPEDGYTNKYSPLMCCDVWEHAYYLDHQNDRGAYINNFWKVVNWEFVNKQFENITN